MTWFLAAAYGQSVENGDFEQGTIAGWTDTSTITEYIGGGVWATTEAPAAALQASPARGAASLAVGPPWFSGCGAMGCPLVEIDVRSDPFVVTRTELSYAAIIDPSQTVNVEVTPGGIDDEIAGPVSADTFSNWVLPLDGSCGATVQVWLNTFFEQDGTPSSSFDDFVLGGTVCPQFADADGDGFCPEGTDLDLDGDCDDPAELSVGVPVDCDDASAAVGQCLVVVSHGRWLEHRSLTSFVVSGAAAGETVSLVGSAVAGTTCLPPASGNLCLDVGSPHTVLDRVVADAAGVATFRFVPRADPYSTLILQAVAIRPNASIASGSVELPVRPGAKNVDPTGVPNGDFEVGTWTRVSEIFGFAAFYTDPITDPCGSVVDGVVSRGAGSLFTEYREGFGSAFEQVDCADTTRSLPVTVTREALRWSHFGGTGSLEVRALATGSAVALDPSTVIAADGFDESVADVSAACGSQVYVEVSAGYLSSDWWDDVAFDGPPCADYADHDGDGLCPAGVDLDGDGACVSDGEPDPIPGPLVEPLGSVIDDFEGAEPPWYQWSDAFDEIAWADAPDQPASGSYGGRLTPYNLTGVSWNGLWESARSRIVTHDTVAVSVSKGGVGDWRATYVSMAGYTADLPTGAFGLSVSDLDVISPSVPPGTWSQGRLDVSSRCGKWLVSVDIEASGWTLNLTDWVYANPDLVYVDDLGFAGAVCPEFVDTNGDGLCAEGIDLDADGSCVSAGEPDPGVIHDPTE